MKHVYMVDFFIESSSLASLIVNACKWLIKSKQAFWHDVSEKIITFEFKKYDDILNHFINICIKEEDKNQMMLFDDDD